MKEGDDGAEEEEEEKEEFDDEQLNNMITREEEEVGILCVGTLMDWVFDNTGCQWGGACDHHSVIVL